MAKLAALANPEPDNPLAMVLARLGIPQELMPSQSSPPEEKYEMPWLDRPAQSMPMNVIKPRPSPDLGVNWSDYAFDPDFGWPPDGPDTLRQNAAKPSQAQPAPKVTLAQLSSAPGNNDDADFLRDENGIGLSPNQLKLGDRDPGYRKRKSDYLQLRERGRFLMNPNMSVAEPSNNDVLDQVTGFFGPEPYDEKYGTGAADDLKKSFDGYLNAMRSKGLDVQTDDVGTALTDDRDETFAKKYGDHAMGDLFDMIEQHRKRLMKQHGF